MGFHCRCRVCHARQVKPKRPEDYVRGPLCRACGRRGTLRLDRWMNNRRQQTCACPGYWFIHRRGSGSCRYNVSDRETFEERAAIMEYEGGLPRDTAELFAMQEQEPHAVP